MDYFKIYGDVWQLHKKYSRIQQDDDEQWERFVNECDEIARRHGNGRFVRDLILAVTNELERVSREAVQNETQCGI